MLRNDYLAARRRYEPENVRLVIVAESPPASGLYLYNPEGRITEPLFNALMKQLGYSCTRKSDGLQRLRQCGWLLVDATYEPLSHLIDNERSKIIQRDYQLLCDDLKSLTPDRSTPLALIKADVCRILEPRLVRDGFNVLNSGNAIPFPSTGHQKQFHEKFGAILSSAKLQPMPSPL
jgi:hypothetical protein